MGIFGSGSLNLEIQCAIIILPEILTITSTTTLDCVKILDFGKQWCPLFYHL